MYWLFLASLLGATAQAADDEVLRSRLTLGTDLWAAPGVEDPALRLLLSERMRAVLLPEKDIDASFHFNGRLSYRLGDDPLDMSQIVGGVGSA